MIRLIVSNLITGKVRPYEFERLYDLDKLAADFGPQITSITKEYKSLRPALDAIAKYLSNNHLKADVIDPEDREEIVDPDVELSTNNGKIEPKNAADLKDVLEDNDPVQIVDIPEMHVLNAASHHWDK